MKLISAFLLCLIVLFSCVVSLDVDERVKNNSKRSEDEKPIKILVFR